MKKIGILEDDEVLGRELQYFLESNGYEARLIQPEEYVNRTMQELVTYIDEPIQTGSLGESYSPLMEVMKNQTMNSQSPSG